MSNIKNNLEEIRSTLKDNVTLVAVSKRIKKGSVILVRTKSRSWKKNMSFCQRTSVGI